MINLPGYIVLPPGVAKYFQIEKNPKKTINLIDKNISDLIIEYFDRNKSCQKCHFKQLIIRWKTSYFAIFSLWEPPKFIKLTYLMILNLIQLVPITPYTVLVEIKVVRNNVINNFELHDQLPRIHSFHSKSLWSWQNSDIL